MKKLPKEKMRAILVDVDGTICGGSARHKYAKKINGKMDWKKYFQKDLLENEKVNEILRNKLLYYKRNNGYKIIFLTGRPENLRNITLVWFEKNAVPVDKLIMRKNNDHSDVTGYKSGEIKKLKRYYNILVAYDDLDKGIEAAIINKIPYIKVQFEE